MTAAGRAGATARLEDLARRHDETGRYATLVLGPASPAPAAQREPMAVA